MYRGFTHLYFKMAVMPLVLETKMADVGKRISFGNLVARKTTRLVLTTTSATSILSRVFGADCMRRIIYKYSRLPTLILFTFQLQGQHTVSIVTSRENTLTLSISTNRINTFFLFLTFDFQQSTATKMYTLCNHSFPRYTF